MTARHLFCAALLSIAFSTFAQTPSAPNPQATTGQDGVLSSSVAEKLLPSAILFKGQLAPVQARNSGVLRLPAGAIVVASLVDSSGYSSGVRERFQFFLYTEAPLQLSPTKVLPSGFYGAGFLADNTMVVLDVSGHDILTTPTLADPSLKRPRPLQMLSMPGTGEVRLYLGRSYVTLNAVINRR